MDLIGDKVEEKEDARDIFKFINKIYDRPFIKRNLLPIIILYLGVFCLVAGYVIHEQLNGYYCTVAYNDWSEQHKAIIPYDNFTERMNEIADNISVDVDLPISKLNKVEVIG